MKKKTVVTKLSIFMNLLVIFLMSANIAFLYYFCFLNTPLFSQKQMHRIIICEAGLTIGCILVGFGIIRLICKKVITLQLTELTEGAQKIAAGDFTARVNIKNRDELGELASAINNMNVYIINLLESVKFTADQLSKTGKLLISTTGKVNNKSNNLHEFTNAFAKTIKKKADIFQNIEENIKILETSIRSIQEKNKNTEKLIKENLDNSSTLVGYLHVSNRDLDHQVQSWDNLFKILKEAIGNNQKFSEITESHLELLKLNKNLVLQIALEAAEHGQKERAQDARKLHEITKKMETQMKEIKESYYKINEVLQKVEKTVSDSGEHLRKIQESLPEIIKALENFGLSMRECGQLIDDINQFSQEGKETSFQIKDIIKNDTEAFQEIIKQATEMAHTARDQHNLICEMESPVKKVARMSDRLHTLSLQFKT